MATFDAAVLVGGRSHRMGTDKAVLEIDGTPLAGRMISLLREAGASLVVTVGGEDRVLGVPHVPDRFPGEGPLGGLIEALRAFRPTDAASRVAPAAFVVVVACDLPGLAPDTVRRLVGAAADSDVVFAKTARREPLCAVWRPDSALVVLERAFASGERAIHRAVGPLRVGEVDVDPGELVNLNTPADVRALRDTVPPSAAN